MNKIKFVKYSGAGNDFVIVSADDLDNFVPSEKEIKQICRRRYGVGADGFLVISKSEEVDFLMQYFNADGTSGVLCGNGARCSIRFAKSRGLFDKNITNFICNGEKYVGRINDNGTISFKFNDPTHLTMNQVVESIYGEINYSAVNTGSPHIVVDVIDNTHMLGAFAHWDDLPVHNLGKELRHNELFSPTGTNVNFVKIADGEILIRTYEKGVEEETLACATGSVAAVLILALKGKVETPVSLKTRGGEVLLVEFEKEEGQISNIWLTGPADEIYEGILNL